jgi:hypothetical protein
LSKNHLSCLCGKGIHRHTTKTFTMFMIITDKDVEEVMKSLTEKRIWCDEIRNQTDLKKLLSEQAPSYKPSEVIGVLVPEEKKPKYEFVTEITYDKKYLDNWKKNGQILDPHPVGFGIVVLDKTKKDKRLARKNKK